MKSRNSLFIRLLFVPVLILVTFTQLFSLDISYTLNPQTPTHFERGIGQDPALNTMSSTHSTCIVYSTDDKKLPSIALNWKALFAPSIRFMLGDIPANNLKAVWPEHSRLNTYRTFITYQHYIYGLPFPIRLTE